jgi:hypothetical protein
MRMESPKTSFLERLRRFWRDDIHPFKGSAQPVHMCEDTILYEPTMCGGDSKGRDEWIQAEAIRVTEIDMKHHPCGCVICQANVLLYTLRKTRRDHGVDPVSGSTLTTGTP